MCVWTVFLSEARETDDQLDRNLLRENENVGFHIQKSDSFAELGNRALLSTKC